MTDPSPKPKSKKIVFTAVVLSAGILVLAGFYLFNYPKENHAKLLPVNSVLYVTASQGNIFSFAKLSQLPLADFFSQAEKEFDFKGLSFKDEILKEVSVASFALVPTDGSFADWVLVLRPKKSLPFLSSQTQINKIREVLLGQKYSQEANGNIVISTSPQALQAVSDVLAGKTFALSSQIKQPKKTFDFLSLYLNSQALAAQFKSNDIAEKFFAAAFKENIYLTLNKRSNGFKFKISGNDILSPSQTSLQTQYLPKDFSFFLPGINLFDVFKSFSSLKPALLESLNQLQSIALTLYQFDLQQATAALFNKPSDIIIFKNTASVWNFDFILIQEPGISGSDLEKLINIFLASRFPQRVSYVLPDSTSVTEIKINREAFTWQSDGDIRYFSNPKLKIAFAYTLANSKLLVASSPELLKRYLSNSDVSIKNFAWSCGLNNQNNIMLLNFKDWPAAGLYLPQSLIGITQEGQQGLFGCIL